MKHSSVLSDFCVILLLLPSNSRMSSLEKHNLIEHLELAESLFLSRKFAESLEHSLLVLQSLAGYSITTSSESDAPASPSSPSPSSPKSTASITIDSVRLPSSGLHDHLCEDGCVCEATVVLVLQLLFELRQHNQIDQFMKRCYPITRMCPFGVFSAWFASSCAQGQPKVTLQAVARLLDYWRDEKSAFLTRRLSIEQRETLLRQLILQALVPDPEFIRVASSTQPSSSSSSTPSGSLPSASTATSVSNSDFEAGLRSAQQHLQSAESWASRDLISELRAFVDDQVKLQQAAEQQQSASPVPSEQSVSKLPASAPIVPQESALQSPANQGSHLAPSSHLSSATSSPSLSSATSTTAMVPPSQPASGPIDGSQLPFFTRLRLWLRRRWFAAVAWLERVLPSHANKRGRVWLIRALLLSLIAGSLLAVALKLARWVQSSDARLPTLLREQWSNFYKLAFSYSFGRFARSM